MKKSERMLRIKSLSIVGDAVAIRIFTHSKMMTGERLGVLVVKIHLLEKLQKDEPT